MSPSRQSLSTRKQGGTLCLKPKGNLVASTVEEQRVSLLKALEGAEGPVCLDMGATEQIDSLGISLVLGLYKTCHKAGLPFSVMGVRPDILRVFKLFSMTKLFSVLEGPA